MTTRPRAWGPDEDTGRWGNIAMNHRNLTAEQAIDGYRQTRRLLKLAQAGKATRAGTVRELYEIKECFLKILLHMQAVDAPVDVTALDE